MTPLECAEGIAEFLKEKFMAYQEYCEGRPENIFSSVDTDVNVYAGFLPRANNRADQKKLCPAVVVRPEATTDDRDKSVTSIVIYATIYDEDMTYGAHMLFHFLEFIRYHLLANNHIAKKWFIDIDDGNIKTTIPDDQPFPQWVGVIEFDVFIPQPRQTHWEVLGGRYDE